MVDGQSDTGGHVSHVHPSPTSAFNLKGTKILVWPLQAKMTKGKDVIVGNERSANSTLRVQVKKSAPRKAVFENRPAQRKVAPSQKRSKSSAEGTNARDKVVPSQHLYYAHHPGYQVWDPYYAMWMQYPFMHFSAPRSDWGAYQNQASSYTDRRDSTSSGPSGAAPISDRFQKSVKPVLHPKANYSLEQVWRVKDKGNIGSLSSHSVPAAKGVLSHEDCKYKQSRWCRSGLTRTQKRRLQRLKFKERCE